MRITHLTDISIISTQFTSYMTFKKKNCMSIFKAKLKKLRLWSQKRCTVLSCTNDTQTDIMCVVSIKPKRQKVYLSYIYLQSDGLINHTIEEASVLPRAMNLRRHKVSEDAQTRRSSLLTSDEGKENQRGCVVICNPSTRQSFTKEENWIEKLFRVWSCWETTQSVGSDLARLFRWGASDSHIKRKRELNASMVFCITLLGFPILLIC